MGHLDPTKTNHPSHGPHGRGNVSLGGSGFGGSGLRGSLAERLHSVPWLLLSTTIHVVVGVLLWALIPLAIFEPSGGGVIVAPAAPPAPIVAATPELPELQTEEQREDAIVTGSAFQDSAEPKPDRALAADAARAATSMESVFTGSQWNRSVGLGTPTGGRYISRATGRTGSRDLSYAEAIQAGLQWLKNHQDEDGKWDCDQFTKHDDPSSEAGDGRGNAVHDIGVTGLALLAFLGDGSTMRSGAHRDVVKKGVLWLRSQQNENGLFGTRASQDYIYDHAIAAYAMCEAYGLSSSQLLKGTAQKGLDYLESHRNPNGVWRYRPQDSDNDTSVTGWCIMAYESGADFGLRVSPDARKHYAAWLDQVSDPSGRHGYSRQGEVSSRKGGDHQSRFPPEKGAAMTAVGLFCRFFMNQDPKQKPVMNAAADLIASKPPVWDEAGGSIDHYYWYHATYAMFQMGGAHWTNWQAKLETAVVKNQHHDKAKPNLYGSWDPKCAWGDDGGRVYSTAILVLTLEANYRYSRLIR